MISRTLFVESKKLRVFDFDDSLVKTNSFVYVTHSNGKLSKLTPGQYAIYNEKPGDTFDFREFDKVINPIEIKQMTDILRKISKKSKETVYILTARAAYNPVLQYLKKIGINRNIFVVALASNNPKDKSDWIERMIDDNGFDDIFFADDSKKNINAVTSMLQKKNVKWKTQLVNYPKNEVKASFLKNLYS